MTAPHALARPTRLLIGAVMLLALVLAGCASSDTTGDGGEVSATATEDQTDTPETTTPSDDTVTEERLIARLGEVVPNQAPPGRWTITVVTPPEPAVEGADAPAVGDVADGPSADDVDAAPAVDASAAEDDSSGPMGSATGADDGIVGPLPLPPR